MTRSFLTRPILLLLVLAVTSALAQQNTTCIGCGYNTDCNAAPVPIAIDGSYHDPCNDPMLVCKQKAPGSMNGTCAWRSCANTDFIPGWNMALASFPERCPSSTSYCPDNGIGCKPLVPLGGACESVRDDECADQSSMCLNYICTLRSAGINSACGIEKIEFRYNYKTSGDAVTQTIERDNCTTGLYCNLTEAGTAGTGFTCVVGLSLGASCTQDRQCQSTSCSNNGGGNSIGKCLQPTDSFHEVKPYIYGIVAAAVAALMLAVLFGLWQLHLCQSRRERDKVARFYKMQETVQNNDSHDQDEEGLHAIQNVSGSISGGKIVLATPKVQLRGSERYTRSNSTLPESLGSNTRHRPDDSGSSSSNYATLKSTNLGESIRSSFRRKPSDFVPGTTIRYGHQEQLLYVAVEEDIAKEQKEQQQQQQQAPRLPFLNVPRLSFSGPSRHEGSVQP